MAVLSGIKNTLDEKFCYFDTCDYLKILFDIISERRNLKYKRKRNWHLDATYL